MPKQTGTLGGRIGDVLSGGGRKSAALLVHAAFWTALGLFFGVQLYLVNAVVFMTPVPWGVALGLSLLNWYLWAALAPAALRLARRFRFDRQSWGGALLVHVPASACFAMLHIVVIVFLLRTFMWTDSEKLEYGFLESVQFSFATKFHWNVLIYWLIVSVSHAVGFYREFQERELREAQLEARLAQAQLQALRMQLHPHFLFNTLHAISALMYTDVAAADAMITRLSDLLRLTLRSGVAQEVLLERELEFLDRYLEIEQVRFEDRLHVTMTIDPDALDALVPNLMLQPLVENAIRHGIAQRAEAGRIAIDAHRAGERLELTVRDDGPGLPGGSLVEGIGLANTRARLAQMYGAAHQFEIGNDESGGALVRIEIPFRFSSHARPEPLGAFV